MSEFKRMFTSGKGKEAGNFRVRGGFKKVVPD